MYVRYFPSLHFVFLFIIPLVYFLYITSFNFFNYLYFLESCSLFFVVIFFKLCLQLFTSYMSSLALSSIFLVNCELVFVFPNNPKHSTSITCSIILLLTICLYLHHSFVFCDEITFFLMISFMSRLGWILMNKKINKKNRKTSNKQKNNNNAIAYQLVQNLLHQLT